MTEDAACHTSPQKLDFVTIMFENKFIVFYMWRFFTCIFLPWVCGTEQIMWFNLNCQFWL